MNINRTIIIDGTEYYKCQDPITLCSNCDNGHIYVHPITYERYFLCILMCCSELEEKSVTSTIPDHPITFFD